jgi:RimJ/RimL family protein N-acetyltransferase
MLPHVVVRAVRETDLPVLFEHQNDPEASRMAVHPSRERDAFMIHWAKLLADDSITKRAIVLHGEVAGSAVAFSQGGRRMVGYWIGREYWGRGLATAALATLLEDEPERPLYAYVAKHNLGSIRVLQKNGFQECDAAALGMPLEDYELLLTLPAPASR